MITVALTQHPLKVIMRGSGDFSAACRRGVSDWLDGMIAGSRNMIGISVATGAAGIIVGTISLTGAHQVVGELVEFLSGGHLMIMLVLVAVMSLILGMGLPTTANYIVVSSLIGTGNFGACSQEWSDHSTNRGSPFCLLLRHSG